LAIKVRVYEGHKQYKGVSQGSPCAPGSIVISDAESCVVDYIQVHKTLVLA